MNKWLIRIFLFGTGIVITSLGIVLCVKCGLGISPISILPYVLTKILPLTLGELTMIFHGVNIAIQYVLEKKLVNIKVLLQVPLAVMFGAVIDYFQTLITVDQTVWVNQWLALFLSIFFTALGMLCMVSVQFIQNPPDGTVRLISLKSHREIGKVKIMYDLTVLGCACVVGIIFLDRTEGLGIATVCSAFLVGKTLSWLKAGLHKIEVKWEEK